MSLVVVGLSHRTVPLDILERMTVPAEHLPKALGDLVSRDFVSEAIILSTCHRTEIYVVAEKFHGGVQDIRHFLTGLAFLPPEDFSDNLFTYHDDSAAAHLFAVAAGLDSVVLGESQILGQVRTAWERARDEQAAGARLSALFRHALEVGKRVRSETAIGRGVTSLSQAAVAMATARLGTLDGRKLVLLGAGEMGEGMADDLAASADASAGDGPDVVVASRTRQRAVRVAEKVGAEVVDIDELPAALAEADVLLSSTGSPTVVLGAAEVARVMASRPSQPLLIVDMGMPRDVDPGVRALSGVTLLDLVDLRAFVEAGLDERRKEVGRVREIVADEVGRFQDAVAERQAAPLVTALRDRAEDLRLSELARYRNRLEGLDPRQQEAVTALTRSILGKLLHEPTVRLKESAGSARGERLAEAIQELFDL
ncbi:MAG: glutamyl-tRNA reductase [Actinomycetota bacterium]|jgi:glutamyl-tRNA reductase|nr:glutamyl-tRNA reductase [Actinomycetota bacterium]